MSPQLVPSATAFIKKASDTANHFGFASLDSLKNDKRCKDCKKIERPKISAIDRRLDSLHGILTNGVCTYFENNLYSFDEPVLFHTIEQIPRSGDVAISLQILGVEKSIAEALLIQTSKSLLDDLGFSQTCVRLNSLGDRESLARYTRELTNFMKRRLEEMPASARELMKEHVLTALMHLIEKEEELSFRSPSPLEFLNETSRKHFREIVEYLDMSGTQYEIDTRLLGHHQCYSQTMFTVEVINEESGEYDDTHIFARGGRYDEFVRSMTRKNVPAVGMVISLKEKRAPARIPKHDEQIPSIFVVHLGFEPKIKSLMLMDTLKKESIPAYQALASDSLSTQLRKAERHRVPISVIVGQKEFVEDTVIVRDMFNSSQESIPTDMLVPYLKKMARK